MNIQVVTFLFPSLEIYPSFDLGEICIYDVIAESIADIYESHTALPLGGLNQTFEDSWTQLSIDQVNQ